jgi:hypothetical protein
MATSGEINMFLTEEIRAKAQDRIAKHLFADAATSLEQLRKVGEEIAVQCGCMKPGTTDPWVYYGPLKNRHRASEKVVGEYGGDWYDLKDVVRMTIIAPSVAELRGVQARIRKECVPQKGKGIIKDTEVFAQVHPCGYSGLIFVVRLPNGRPGEIQVNIPEIIYGKEKERVALPGLGAHYHSIKCRFGIEGGRHHVLYEIYREAPAGAIGREAAQVSKLYLNYLRGLPNLQLLEQLKRALSSIMSKEPSKFLH